MEKHKLNSLYPIILLLAMLFLGIAGHAQKYTFTGPGNWNEAAKWTNSPSADFLAGTIDIGGGNIEINDTCKVIAPLLSIISAGEIVIKNGATLDVWGNVAFDHDLFKVGVENGGFFVVHGNVSVASAITLNIDVIGGYFSVDGNFDQQGTITGGLNNSPHVYITGTKTGTYFNCADPSAYVPVNGTCNYGNRAAIASNETIAIRKLLLGTLAIGFTPTLSPPLCNGGSDGSITVQGTGGSHAYQYSINDTEWFPASYTGGSYTFLGLSAGDHILYVRDDDTPQTLFNTSVTLGQPDELTHTVTGNPYFCTAGTGAFTVNVSGGTPPFTVKVNGVDYTGGPTEYLIDYSGKAAGTYTVNVTDANDCVSTSGEQSITLILDNTAPVCSYPDDYAMTITDFTTRVNAATSGPITSITNVAPRAAISTDPDTIIYVLNSKNFDKLRLSVSVSQTAAATWTNTDFLEIQWADGINETGHSLLIDRCVWKGESDNTDEGANQPGTTVPTQAQMTMPDAASGVEELYLFFIYNTTASNAYAVAAPTVTAKNVLSIIKPTLSGEPYDCTDNTGVAPAVIFVDSDINWECNTPGNREFWFNRTWKVTDACGNENTAALARVQRIMVGTPPTITAPSDLTFDICHNQSVKIDIPTFSDNCIASISWEVTTNGSGAIPASGDPVAADNDITVSFTQPLAGAGNLTYTITWTVTDAAGFSASTTQNVTILAPISIALAPLNPNFCTGEAATFTITVTGGTGVYNNSSVDLHGLPIDGVWSWSGNKGTFTTSGLVLGGTQNITVSILDANTAGDLIIGGCSSGNILFEHGEGLDYFIHEKISTNQITRD